MPYQPTGNLWPAWPRFFLMLAVLLALDSAWAYLVLYTGFVKVPANASRNDLAVVQAAWETNALVHWGLGMAFNAGLLVWSLRQRHIGEAVAACIGLLWLTFLSFCFYLLISFGYGLASMLETIQRAKHR